MNEHFKNAIRFISQVLLLFFGLSSPGLCQNNSEAIGARVSNGEPKFESEAVGRRRERIKNFVGINGHTVLFKPDLYRPVCRLVRDYHPIEWDLGDDSSTLPKFPFAKNGVDWQSVYGSWEKNELEIDVCLMFETIESSKWKDLEKDCYRYGRKFAESFGPKNKGPVRSIEIGNEPGKWSDSEYEKVFRSMAKGIRDGDPEIIIATCNVNVGSSGDWHKSVDCISKYPDLYDVLSIHTYALKEEWPTWKRSYPEDDTLEKFLGDIDRLIQWRDQNGAGKSIWITEFGWDACTKEPAIDSPFSKWVDNSDLEQSQWLVRALLLFQKLEIERAYIYFFNDDDKPEFHGSSGITRGFEPKPSFFALKQFQRLLGDCCYLETNEFFKTGRIAKFVSAQSQQMEEQIWVLWLASGVQASVEFELEHAGWEFVDGECFAKSDSIEAVKFNEPLEPKWKLSVTESPVYLKVRKTSR